MATVKDVMSKAFYVMPSKVNVEDAAKLMAEKDAPCVLVSVDDIIVGIVTERDIVRKIVAEGFRAKDVLLENIMTTPLITVQADATIEEASKLMITYNVRRLPVMQGDQVIGLVTATEIAATCAREVNYSDPRLNALARVPKEQLPPSYG